MKTRSVQAATVAWLLLFSRAAPAQSPTPLGPPTKQTFTFVGCVKNVLSDKPWAAIQDTDTGITYPITNFNLKD